jgi:hypothetical protein
MLVAQRINDFVTTKRPTAICDKCIANGVGLANHTAHPAQITGAFGTTSDFVREKGMCGICKNEKTVIRRV